MKLLFNTILFAFISMNSFAMPIYIETPDNGTLTIDVESSDSIENVKAKIEDATGISIDLQVLKFNDLILEDGRTLSDYGIEKQNTLFLELASLNITGTDINDFKIYLSPNPSKDYIRVYGLKDLRSFHIYDTSGNIIIKSSVSSDETINISNLNKGLYILNIENIYSFKFIKE